MSATRHRPWTILGRVALGLALVLSLPGPATPAPAPGAGQWVPTAPAGAPEARWQHAAVWTGSRMIVWGGASATDEPNTGGLFDPDTDSWTPMSTDGALSCYDPRAVWTGSKMIVWGALSYDWLNVGQAYDPASDSWSATATAGAPTARSGHTAVWAGSRMIVWGGWDYENPALPQTSTGGRYDPVTDAWTPTSLVGAPSPREHHTAVWTGSRMIVWGGYRREARTTARTDTGALYDPTSDTWTPMSTIGAPTARDSHTAVWTGSRMVVWGGYDGVPGVPAGTGGIYDPATDSWTPVTSTGAPSGRSDHTAVWTGSRMIVWGGWPGGRSAEDTGGVYDPATDTWTATSMVDVPTGRQYHTAVWTGSKMIVWGGFDATGEILDSGASYSLPPAARHDFDGDRKPDVLWHNQATGDLYAWYMNGVTRASAAHPSPSRVVDTRWQVAGMGDLDLDGRNDLLWHNQATGDLYVWFLSGTGGLTQRGYGYLSPSAVDTTWKVQGIADFNGDGQQDILWQRQTDGTLYVWFMNGLTRVGVSYLTPGSVNPQWQIRGVADFNGDGKNDLLWHNQATGSLYVWFLGGTNGVVRQSPAVPTPSTVADTQWLVAEVADFNADGKPDVLWHHQASGSLYIWYLGGTSGIVRQGADFLSPSSVVNSSWKVAPR